MNTSKGKGATAGQMGLWDFALALYSSPEVEEMALFLQDQRGLRVNILLWASWLEVRGITLDRQLLQRAESRIASWEDEVVRPLRSLRRRLKEWSRGEQRVGDLREQVKAAELAAERRTLDELDRLAPPHSGGSPISSATNCGFYLMENGLDPQLDPKLADALRHLGSASAALTHDFQP